MSFTQPVSEYMTAEVESVGTATRLPDVARLLERWNISAVPVTDLAGAPLGVVSRTDLLRLARRDGSSAAHGSALRVPDLPAVAAMTRGCHVTGRHAPLAGAAERLWREQLHRLFVVQDQRLVGVLSTTDIACAVRDAGLAWPIEEIMSSPLHTIETVAPLGEAIVRLEHTAVSGLIVVEDGWPVGMFTQVEALASRGLPEDTRVDDVFDQGVVCVPAETPVWRAAGFIAQFGVRRVVVCRNREPVGVVTGLDLAGAVAVSALVA